MDRGAWRATVHGVAESRTGLSNQAHTQEEKHSKAIIKGRTLAKGRHGSEYFKSFNPHPFFKHIDIYSVSESLLGYKANPGLDLSIEIQS